MSIQIIRRGIVLFTAVTAAATSMARAADHYWDGNSSPAANMLGTNSNWNDNLAPVNGSPYATGTQEHLIDNSIVTVPGTLYVGNSALQLGALTIDSPTLESIYTNTSGTGNRFMVFNQAAGLPQLSLGAHVGGGDTPQTVTIADGPGGPVMQMQFKTDSVINVTNANATLNISALIVSLGTTTGLEKTGDGTLVLGNAGNTFGGAGKTIKISGGVLSVVDSARLGNANNTITLNGGVLQLKPTAALNLTRGIIVSSAGGGIETAGALGTATTVTVANLSGDGTLTKTGTARLLLSSANTAFSGSLTIKAGPVQVRNTTSLKSTSTVKLDGTLADNPTLDLRADVDSNFGNNIEIANFGQVFIGNVGAVTAKAFTVGNVFLAPGATFMSHTTAGYSLATGAIQLGGDATVSTTLNLNVASIADAGGNSSLSKANTGTLTINGNAAYGGGTTVLAGTFKLASTATMANSTGIDVRAGAVFDAADLAGFSVQSLAGGGTVNGVLTAAAVNPTGTLTSVGSLTVSGVTTIDLTSVDAFDSITAQSLVLNDVQAVFDGAFAEGDAFHVFNAAAFNSGGVFSFSGLGDSLAANFDRESGVISLSAIPEPGSLAWSSLIGLAMCRRRRAR